MTLDAIPRAVRRPPTSWFRGAWQGGALALALALSGCGGDGGSDPVPVASVDALPETVTLYVGETRRATAQTRDGQGNVLPDRRVTWATSAPAVASVTDSGVITAVGAGTAQITARSEGREDVVGLTVLAPVASVTVTPAELTLDVGQEQDLAVAIFDAAGAPLSGRPIQWFTSNANVASVSLSGRVRGVGPGTALITVTSETKSAAATVTVTGTLGANCGEVAPSVLAVGEVRTLAGAERGALCLPAGGEYTLIAFSALEAGRLPITFEARGTSGAAGTPVPERAPAAGITLGGAARSLASAASFEHDLRTRTRSAARALAPGARRAVAERRGRPAAGGVSLSLAALALQTGDYVTLNTSAAGGGCTAPRSDRTGRVVAVSTRAVVVADTTNPANGFTDDEYRSFATAFDNLVYPVDVAAFGEPTDIDESGRTIIFFTRAVNELTPANVEYVIGGFFFGRDLLPRAPVPAQDYPGCAGSNEAEMFYMLVPDPTGVVNGNKRTKEFVGERTVGVLGHEFEHLINFGRRLYVNDATEFEETWLDEGLAHVAEELLFYRSAAGTGLAPRTNITLQALTATQATVDAVNRFQVSNLGRLATYLEATASNSPYASNDELQTRGATWQLLRYAADQRGGDENQLWRALVNSRVSGFANLRAALAAEPIAVVRDWAVAQYLDDTGLGGAPAHAHPSWHFRSVLPALTDDEQYPLATRALLPGFTLAELVAGGAAYLRFGVAPGGDNGYLAATSQGAALPAALELMLVRTQ